MRMYRSYRYRPHKIILTHDSSFITEPTEDTWKRRLKDLLQALYIYFT